MQTKTHKSMADWIYSESLVGHYIFTLETLRTEFPQMTPQHIAVSLSRLTKKGVIVSPWHGFYVIVPTEYRLKGVVPPIFWIDSLMKYLKRDYYVSLLNAAEFYGAAHQRPMSFSVMVQGSALRSGVKNKTEIIFSRKTSLAMDFVKTFPTQTGSINVSSPELTALDLVACQETVGGLNRVSTVLSELSEQMHWETTDASILTHYSAATAQRLGYILENMLGETLQAEALMHKIRMANIPLRRAPLKIGVDSNDFPYDTRWHITQNIQIEIDEL